MYLPEYPNYVSRDEAWIHFLPVPEGLRSKEKNKDSALGSCNKNIIDIIEYIFSHETNSSTACTPTMK